MSIFEKITSYLTKADDQGNNWYSWSENQCSHALFGCIWGLWFPEAAILMALIPALLKECFDLIKSPSAKTAKDSFIDIGFWVLGGIIAIQPIIGAILLSFALLCGVIPRVRKAK